VGSNNTSSLSSGLGVDTEGEEKTNAYQIRPVFHRAKINLYLYRASVLLPPVSRETWSDEIFSVYSSLALLMPLIPSAPARTFAIAVSDNEWPKITIFTPFSAERPISEYQMLSVIMLPTSWRILFMELFEDARDRIDASRSFTLVFSSFAVKASTEALEAPLWPAF
jgi:hypothetical protein